MKNQKINQATIQMKIKSKKYSLRTIKAQLSYSKMSMNKNTTKESNYSKLSIKNTNIKKKKTK